MSGETFAGPWGMVLPSGSTNPGAMACKARSFLFWGQIDTVVADFPLKNFIPAVVLPFIFPKYPPAKYIRCLQAVVIYRIFMDYPESHIGWESVNQFVFNIAVKLSPFLFILPFVQNEINGLHGVFQGKLIQDQTGQVIIKPFFLLLQFGIQTFFICGEGIQTETHPRKLSKKNSFTSKVVVFPFSSGTNLRRLLLGLSFRARGFFTAPATVRFLVVVLTAKIQMVKKRDRPFLAGLNPKSPLSSK